MKKINLKSILIATVLFQSFAPFIGVAYGTDNGSFVTLCTSYGFQKVYLDDKGAPSGNKKGAHCPFCLLPNIDDSDIDKVVFESFKTINSIKKITYFKSDEPNKALLSFAMLPVGSRAPPI
ncbi:MAG: hypothetical protein DRQ51_01885 [Gammaproteobacteria bacterium]|nr:MAG: hypothetical protein DRQ51_01885 [Gammaproteobacteria bacterium]